MSKFRKNVLSVRKNRLTQSGQLSLEAAGLSTILWKKDVPDSPLFQFFFLSDLEEFMSVLVDINEEKLQDVMNSLTSKGFLSAYYQLDIDQETNVRDRVFLIQKLQQNENTLLSLEERAILQIISLALEQQERPIIFSGFIVNDMFEYLNSKFAIPIIKSITLIRELIERGYAGKHQLVKNEGDESITLCFTDF